MKRKHLYTNILDTRFELFGDFKYEDEEEEEEAENFDKIIDNDLNDIDKLIKEIGILGDEDSVNEVESEYESGCISNSMGRDVSESYNYNYTIQLAFIGGLVFVTNLFIYLHYSQQYSKWEETNQKYLITWFD